ncbi:MAG: hypothetical protein WCV72_01550 [Patescibacteria group bacterium]
MPFGITERAPTSEEIKFFNEQYRLRSKNPYFDHHDFFYDMVLSTGCQVLCEGVRKSIRDSMQCLTKKDCDKKRNKHMRPENFARAVPYRAGSILAEWENPFGFFSEIQKIIAAKKNIKS